MWVPGDAAQCDLWFPPRKMPLEDGSRVLLPVLVVTTAYSRFILARMIPTRRTEDLLLATWELLAQLGRVPRRLIWDNEPGIGRGKRHADRWRRSRARRMLSAGCHSRWDSPPGTWRRTLLRQAPSRCCHQVRCAGTHAPSMWTSTGWPVRTGTRWVATAARISGGAVRAGRLPGARPWGRDPRSSFLGLGVQPPAGVQLPAIVLSCGNDHRMPDRNAGDVVDHHGLRVVGAP